MSEVSNDNMPIELTREMLWQSLMLNSNIMLWHYLASVEYDNYLIDTKTQILKNLAIQKC